MAWGRLLCLRLRRVPHFDQHFSIVRSPASSNPSMPGRALLYDLDRGR
jgi:hypothetical protein